MSGCEDLKLQIKKGNNKQDKNKGDTEEASRLLLEEFFLDSDNYNENVGTQYELENACEQISFKISHIEVG